MKNSEAIKTLRLFPKWNKDDKWLTDGCMKDLVDLCISAIKENRRYRQIGTVEQFREAMEKQKAKIPDIWGDGYADGQLVYDMYACPNCGENYEIDYDHHDYCPKCGQHMDKSDKVFE